MNELRQILRTNRPAVPDLAAPIREASARQATVMRANRGPDTAFRGEAGLPQIINPET